MIAQLVTQFGLELSALVPAAAGVITEGSEKSYNVFHVADALNSPHIPAQERFVVPYGIRSVVGFGGMLPAGDLFAVILFSRVRIPRERADLFRTLSLNVKLAILPFADGPVFQ